MSIGCVLILAYYIYRIQIAFGIISFTHIPFEDITIRIIYKNYKVIYIADYLSGDIVLKGSNLLSGVWRKLHFNRYSRISFRK